ncbi:uncharacterized protein TRAVEDRAFT_54713 [Trametes versicolor FP-101664 SS1]|uniref:Uncharacterized protein n=1 Tax=Trametes versicolor (strain FP-101664) TaxID=717944 RepID=R7S6S6_TRAVS|nr:uncharacterized protein TRAVEDRAFT_54713 [Trametes versicolor FP-101664 SS1]EIW51267.1 hypothetical protein TRAVEDRAFT_54713 [Trametes versicolor FP-101664 SS1]
MNMPKRYFKILRPFIAPDAQRAVKWDDFYRLFVNHFEFDVKRGKGRVHAFTPPTQGWVFAPKKFLAYKPKRPELTPTEVRDIRKTLKEVYGWGPNSFTGV